MDAIDNMVTYLGGEAAMANIPGGFANPELPAAIRHKAAELLDVPHGTDPDEKDLRNARHRYAVLKQAIEKFTEQGQGGQAQMPDDKMEQEVPPEMNSPLVVPPQLVMSFATMPSVQPLPNVDNHQVYVNFYKDAIKDAVDSDGIENHPITKAVLMALIAAHENQGVMDAQAKVAQQVAVQAPMQMAQNAQEAQKADTQHQQEMEKSDATHKQGLESQVVGSKLKENEIKAQGAQKKSELSKVKV
jgi:hypothetical protein